MPRSVSLTFAAARDLEQIIDYITVHDAPEKAEYVLAQMEKAFSSLSDSPARGVRPRELVALGIREYREIFFKPYRIIYRVDGEAVTILLIADGRRDMQALLQRRLLED
jgi:toxin ParE1/3/4